MANGTHHNQFTAVDMEKYHKGLLSAQQMHDLEKAALDDPFLAEAMEGYAEANTDVASDIEELRERLAGKTQSAKIIPLVSRKQHFHWWKIAALVLFVGGAGLLAYQLGGGEKNDHLAQSTEPASVKPGSSPAIDSPQSVPVPNRKKNEPAAADKNTTPAKAKRNTSEKATEQPVPLAPKKETVYPPAANRQFIANHKAKDRDDRDEEAKVISLLKGKIAGLQVTDSLSAAAQPTETSVARNNMPRMNVFRGRVTDISNNAVPFANVTNPEDSVGTYTDAKGFFTLTSTDSILNVQVRSLGFASNNAQLQNGAGNNQVVLREDRSNMAEVVISNKKVNTDLRSRNNNMVLEEPEPIDGWTNYDTYLANNLNIPETIKAKQTGGEVEVSFEVNKDGEPVNIRIERSLCETCDKEAIRLVKQGPKWKRKARKGRTKVTISF